ncbi:GTPase Era [Arhodomonas aquaeolei]|uniref:GTPase Era n=1 Tax=Arhodomonas aquaeolei TaxID=2369 RepID=UPI0021671552|nr:GTPase Era [Arhodomonas aquaeolei]MCS4503620.1 GTPase Era [Arhodomonas aquaeolei]
MSTATETMRSGFVALMGRPNAGKSTLLNALLGQKVSIVTRKPQTTRHRIIGVHHIEGAQLVYVDTPGLHRATKTAMNRYLNEAAGQALDDVDVVLVVVDASRWTEDDDLVFERLKSVRVPVVLAINKVDRIPDKTQLLPLIERLSRRHDFAAVVPVSAQRHSNLEALEQELVARLPEGPALFPEEQVTDRSERFMAAELIREQLMAGLGEELPYATTVEIEAFEQEGRLRRIAAVIWVERPGQKKIVIGGDGRRLKSLGRSARLEMERLFDGRVYLQLWVKVREGWSDDERALRSLGYGEF